MSESAGARAPETAAAPKTPRWATPTRPRLISGMANWSCTFNKWGAKKRGAEQTLGIIDNFVERNGQKIARHELFVCMNLGSHGRARAREIERIHMICLTHIYTRALYIICLTQAGLHAHLIRCDLLLQSARGVRKQQIEMRDRRRAKRVAQARKLGATLLKAHENGRERWVEWGKG